MSFLLFPLQASHRLPSGSSHWRKQVRTGLSFRFLTIRYFYIVKGSVTVDPDIMLHEVRNYKLRIPPFISVGLVEWMESISLFFCAYEYFDNENDYLYQFVLICSSVIPTILLRVRLSIWMWNMARKATKLRDGATNSCMFPWKVRQLTLSVSVSVSVSSLLIS